ncbi:MAG TPA: 30S ribosomal protein THX, partial [Gemmatimonadaceae bacterium]|nr:30S ribosomal protein THX [Gemmatimonadaceae bacterium]
MRGATISGDPGAAPVSGKSRGLCLRPPSEDHGGFSMGKGDQRTRRGKIYRGTFGKSRPKPKKKA